MLLLMVTDEKLIGRNHISPHRYMHFIYNDASQENMWVLRGEGIIEFQATSLSTGT